MNFKKLTNKKNEYEVLHNFFYHHKSIFILLSVLNMLNLHYASENYINSFFGINNIDLNYFLFVVIFSIYLVIH